MANIYGIQFDRVNDFFDLEDNPAMDIIRANSSGFYAFWLEIDSLTGNQYQYFFSNGSYNGTDHINVYTNNSSDVFQLKGGGSDSTTSTSVAVPTGKIFVVAHYNAANNRLEISHCSEGGLNNRSVSTNVSFNDFAGANWNLGRRQDANADRYYGGKIFNFAKGDIYLTDANIEALAADFLNYDPTDNVVFTPAIYFPINEGTGTTITDTQLGLIGTGIGFPTDSSHWTFEGSTGGGLVDVSTVLSLTNNAAINIKAQKVNQQNISVNNNTAISIKGQKLSCATLSNDALSTASINSSKQVSAKVSANSVNTVNMKCFKQAYGSLQLNNIVVVTLNGQKVVADTRSAILLLTNQTIVTLKTQKLARSQLSLQANASINSYGQKVAVSSLTTTSLAITTINGSKVSIDSRNAILSLSNATIVTIKAHKQNTASVNLSNAANVTIVVQKSANSALNLQNYVTTKITKHSDSYIPVVRRLCIQGQLVTLSIPANINNKLIIKGSF